jgi:hypothetical protein
MELCKELYDAAMTLSDHDYGEKILQRVLGIYSTMETAKAASDRNIYEMREIAHALEQYGVSVGGKVVTSGPDLTRSSTSYRQSFGSLGRA